MVQSRRDFLNTAWMGAAALAAGGWKTAKPLGLVDVDLGKLKI